VLFKEEKLRDQLQKADPRLWNMAENFDRVSQEIAGLEAVITRVTDPVAGESGVHPAGRAFDVRNESRERRRYTDHQVTRIVHRMNELYPRGDGKPSCIHHSFQGGPWHFHLQLQREES
jgi:hypothetical protein